jgi:hypothetical protein
MAIRDDFTAGEVLAAADLNDTFGAKLNLAGGKILQIVRATDVTSRSTTSTSFVDVTGMSVTITPQKSDSSVIVIATSQIESAHSSTSATRTSRLSVTDSSNNVVGGINDPTLGGISNAGSGTQSLASCFTIFAYVTPATLSAVTYKLRMKSDDAGTTTSIKNNLITGQMYAIEVSA